MLDKKKLLEMYKNNILLGPLNGVVILGFCYYVSGPMALQSLVSQGALVIKVERKPIGDPSRYVFSKGLFNSMAHNQLSIALDFDNSSDLKLLASLMEIADAIVDNRSVKAKKNDFMLQNHFLNSNKPHSQVYCSINGYPNEEVNNEPGLDASVQAATGLAYTNCASADVPLKVGVPVLDQVAGLLASNHIIANLYFLLRYPFLPESAAKMIYISVSMAGVSLWLQTGQVIRALEGENEFLREGNQDQFAVPFSYYTTSNGLMSVATVNEAQFKKFCLAVLKDPVFHKTYETIHMRLKNQTQFEHDLNERLKVKSREEWCNLCREHEIPASPVLTVSEAIKQNFFSEVINYTSNNRAIITNGARNSFFPPAQSLPGPKLSRDYEGLMSLYETTSESNDMPKTTFSKCS